MATNINRKVEKRVVELVKSCYFGNGLNKDVFKYLYGNNLEFIYER